LARRSQAELAAVSRIPPHDRLAPPSELNAQESAIFRLTVAASGDRFRPEDLPFLCAYSRCVVLERQTSEELTAARASGEMLSQRLAAYSCAVKSMLALGARLRLGPLARVSHNRRAPGKPSGGVSYYELMQQGGDDDEPDRPGGASESHSNGEGQ
jgi:hypothetical protein